RAPPGWSGCSTTSPATRMSGSRGGWTSPGTRQPRIHRRLPAWREADIRAHAAAQHAPMSEARPGRLRLCRRLAAAWLHDRRQFREQRLPRTCPICGYHGVFVAVGHPPRWDARCPGCGSRERHRLVHLWITEGGGDRLAGKRILHFSPEKAVMRRMGGNALYETADLHQKGVTHRVNITRTGLPGAAYDVVM